MYVSDSVVAQYILHQCSVVGPAGSLLTSALVVTSPPSVLIQLIEGIGMPTASHLRMIGFPLPMLDLEGSGSVILGGSEQVFSDKLQSFVVKQSTSCLIKVSTYLLPEESLCLQIACDCLQLLDTCTRLGQLTGHC